LCQMYSNYELEYGQSMAYPNSQLGPALARPMEGANCVNEGLPALP